MLTLGTSVYASFLREAPVTFPNLTIGVKRRLYRRDDVQSTKFDAVFQAVRGAVLKKNQYRCVFCGARSASASEVHHLDDNHRNNQLENLATVCKLCHPYHHIGQASLPGQEKGLGEGHIGADHIALIRVPNSEAIPARDMNALQRAIALALCDEQEAHDAARVLKLLTAESNRRDLVQALFGENAKNAKGAPMRRVHPADVAAALTHLTDDEYARRDTVLGAVRVLYHPQRLAEWGRQWRKDKSTGALANPHEWCKLLEKPLAKVLPALSSANESVSVSAVFNDSDDDSDQ